MNPRLRHGGGDERFGSAVVVGDADYGNGGVTCQMLETCLTGNQAHHSHRSS